MGSWGFGKRIALGVAALLAGGPNLPAHPHLSPLQMTARVREIDAVLAQDPPADPAQRVLLLEEQAQLLDALGRLEEALVLFEEAIRLTPLDGRTPYNLGLLLLARNRPAHAVPWLERAAALAPAEPQFGALLAEALARAGLPRRAARVWEEQAGRERDRELQAERLGAAARCREEAGERAAAAVLLDRAVAATPESPLWLVARAHFRERAGDPAAAAADFGAAAALAPGSQERHLWLLSRGEALQQAGRAEEARPAYLQAVAEADRQLGEEPAFGEDLLYHRARALAGLGRMPEAAAALEKALEILPGEPLYLKLGLRVFPAAGQEAAAERCRRALAADEARMAEIRAEDRVEKERQEEAVRQALARAGLLRAVCRALREGTDPAPALARLAASGGPGPLLAGRLEAEWCRSGGRPQEALALLAKLGPQAEAEAWAASLRLKCLEALGRGGEGARDRQLLTAYLEAAKR